VEHQNLLKPVYVLTSTVLATMLLTHGAQRVSAQSAYFGSIAGTVQDPSGAAVPGADLTVRNLANSSTQNISSDATGTYEIRNLIPGSYEIVAAKYGFNNATVRLVLDARQQVRKDLRLELRTLETVPAMVLFSVATFVIFHFALNRATIAGQLAAGILTATLLFASQLAVNRLFVAEREQGGFDGFLLAPVDRSALLVAKALALLLFLIVLEVIAVPAFALLLLGPSIGPPLGGLVVLLRKIPVVARMI